MVAMVKFTQPDTFDWINMLVYGPFGSGKTILSATAQLHEETKETLFIDAEGGSKSIRDQGIKLNIFRINTFPAFNKLYEFCRTHSKLRDMYLAVDPKSSEGTDLQSKLIKLESWIKEIPEDKIKKPTLYRTVVIDSLTEVQKYAMYHILGIDINKVALDEDVTTPQIQHWGKGAEIIRMLVRAFRDIDMHTVFTTLDQTVKDESDGSISVKPSLPGKLPDEVCGFLDIVGYLHVKQDPKTKEPVRVLQVQPIGKYHAKSRYKVLGNYVEEPTIPKILNLIKGEEKK